MDTTLSAPIGQLLDGRYLVESQIARGGMATVYHARDVRLERIVALKIAHPELASDQRVRRAIHQRGAVSCQAVEPERRGRLRPGLDR